MVVMYVCGVGAILSLLQRFLLECGALGWGHHPCGLRRLSKNADVFVLLRGFSPPHRNEQTELACGKALP